MTSNFVPAGLTVLAMGCTVGWTTVALKKLESADSPIPLTKSQASWIASAHDIGHMISPIPAGLVVNIIGPKKCLIVSAIIESVGWLLIIFTRDIMALYITRLLFGISMGIIFTIAPLYLAEISSPELRGAFGVSFESWMYLGHVVEFTVGPYVSYEVLGIVSLSIPVVFLLMSFWMAESPYFYVRKNNHDAAKKTYSKLSGLGENQLQLLHNIDKIEEQIEAREHGRLKDLFGSAVYRRFLMIVLVLALVQRFSGMSAVVAYAAFIFPNTIGGLSSSWYTILFGVITLLFTFVSAGLIDKAGRRVLTMTSCFGGFIVELLTSLYFFLALKNIVDTTYISWIPFITISSYAGFYSIGMGPIVTIIQSELFPPNIKGVAASIVTIVHAGSSSVVTKMYQVVSDSWGYYVSFFIFSLSCLFGSIFTYFFVPETKGKSLIEIQDNL